MKGIVARLDHRDGYAIVSIGGVASEGPPRIDEWQELRAIVADHSDESVLIFDLTGARWSVAAYASVEELEAASAVTSAVNDCLGALDCHRMPTISLIEGECAAEAVALALACDVALASTSAVLNPLLVSTGRVPSSGTAWLLTEQLGRYRAAELLWRGRAISAQEAFDLGLLSELVNPGYVVSRAETVAIGLSGIAPAALWRDRAILSGARGMTLEESLRAFA